MTARAPTPQDLDRELARARGARRLLPWAVLTAVGGGTLGLAAGGGVRSALALAGVGLLFALFTLAAAVPRCPACGAPLRGKERPSRCAGCGAAF